METKKVAIVGYNRIPFARINTAYSDKGNQDLLVAFEWLDRSLQPKRKTWRSCRRCCHQTYFRKQSSENPL
jgi:hypothetical protein